MSAFAVDADVLTLADLLQAEWPAVRERIRLSGHPTCEGDDAADDADKDDAKDQDEPAAKSDDDADDDKIDKDDDWQAKARKHESRAKREARDRAKATKERDELAAKLADIEKANLSEKEREIKAAREEATVEVTTKYESMQRADRIENAVTKLSLRGFKAKDKDGNEITLRFADPDDAQLRIDRALRNEDLTYDEIYADGKVQTEAITSFLTELLEEHPRLRADEPNGNGKKEVVDFDGGKGKGGGTKSLEEMTPDEHLKEVQGSRR